MDFSQTRKRPWDSVKVPMPSGSAPPSAKRLVHSAQPSTRTALVSTLATFPTKAKTSGSAHRAAGSLVHAARLHPYEAALHNVDAPNAIVACDLRASTTFCLSAPNLRGLLALHRHRQLRVCWCYPLCLWPALVDSQRQSSASVWPKPKQDAGKSNAKSGPGSISRLSQGVCEVQLSNSSNTSATCSDCITREILSGISAL